jgi:NADPH:quinone reductase-like Zn-dependent oxidoreductase
MKAVVLKGYGDADQLSYEEAATPVPGEGEVLVKVGATSINPIDWKLRSGAMRAFMPLEFPAILGYDLAGEVASAGPGVVEGVAPGDRVMALASRTYAEYVAVKASALAPIPDVMSFEEAAALPLVTLTGAQLIERGVRPKRGQSLLLTGALGGVGRTAAYVANQHHAQVIAAVRPSQIPAAESLGTLALVSLDDEEALSHFKEIDALADTVGGAVAAGLLKHLRHGAVVASVVGFPEEARDYDLHTVMVEVESDAIRLKELATDVSRKRLKIPIARVMKLAEAGEAHRFAQAGGVGGKIVLVP